MEKVDKQEIIAGTFTWGELKKQIEKLGVKDEDTVAYIDYNITTFNKHGFTYADVNEHGMVEIG